MKERSRIIRSLTKLVAEGKAAKAAFDTSYGRNPVEALAYRAQDTANAMWIGQGAKDLLDECEPLNDEDFARWHASITDAYTGYVMNSSDSPSSLSSQAQRAFHRAAWKALNDLLS